TGERAGELSHAALIELARRCLRAPARAPSRHAQRAKGSEFWGETAKPPRIAPWGLLFTDPRPWLATREKWLRERAASARFRAPSSREASKARKPPEERGVRSRTRTAARGSRRRPASRSPVGVRRGTREPRGRPVWSTGVELNRPREAQTNGAERLDALGWLTSTSCTP